MPPLSATVPEIVVHELLRPRRVVPVTSTLALATRVEIGARSVHVMTVRRAATDLRVPVARSGVVQYANAPIADIAIARTMAIATHVRLLKRFISFVSSFPFRGSQCPASGRHSDDGCHPAPPVRGYSGPPLVTPCRATDYA
jgi:hypothetical protein